MHDCTCVDVLTAVRYSLYMKEILKFYSRSHIYVNTNIFPSQRINLSTSSPHTDTRTLKINLPDKQYPPQPTPPPKKKAECILHLSVVIRPKSVPLAAVRHRPISDGHLRWRSASDRLPMTAGRQSWFGLCSYVDRAAPENTTNSRIVSRVC